MSVINKMLRDLDQRQSPGSGAADPLRRHTASVVVAVQPRRSPSLRWATWLLPVAAMVAAAFAWWSFQQPQPVPAAAVPLAKAADAAPALAAIASAPAPVAPLLPPIAAPASAALAAVSPAPVAAVAAPHSMGLRMDSTLSSPVTSAPVPQTTAAPPAPVVSAASVAAQAPSKPPPSGGDVVAPGVRQQQAGREALAQAQALWAGGARDTAISTLQEAVATAERAPVATAASTLVPMVRELARMELDEGRPAAVWELLTRLEPLLVNQPELWALRANAAQRLGRHQDSVQAYTTALQSRPSEQRWLLGAAVSLAALGQTGPAAEMADKARAVGPVSREVLAYLRQQGVPLTERP